MPQSNDVRLAALTTQAIACEGVNLNPNNSIELVLRFWRELWNPPYNLAVIDEILSEDFVLVSAGTEIVSRAAFKEWVMRLNSVFHDGRFYVADTLVNSDGTKVVARWRTTGINNGMFGLPPDRQAVEFTGISILQIRGDRIVQQWAERSALECYQRLSVAT